MKFKVILFLLFLSLVSKAVAYAPETVCFIWDPNTEPDLVQYMLYRSTTGTFTYGGTGSPNYVRKMTAVPNEPAYCQTCDFNLPAGIYYWTLTAWDSSGNESAPSTILNRVIENMDTSAPLSPGGFNFNN